MGSLTALVLCLALTVVNVQGDFNADCQKPEEWQKYQSSFKDVTYSDLSECQRKTLDFDTNNKILLGAEGDASTIGISLGGDGGGCTSGSACMRFCQALCCITNGCKIAMMRKKTDKDCEVSCDIYKEETDSYLCYMFSAGNKESGSDSRSGCYTNPNAPNLDNCRAIAADPKGFGWNSTTFDYMKSLQVYTTCPEKVTRRKLLAPVKVEKYPNVAKLVKDGLKQATCGFKSKIQTAAKKAGGAQKLLKKIQASVKAAKV